MRLLVKVSQFDFKAARSGGYAYGFLMLADNKKPEKTFAVYVELGVERAYQPSPRDDKNTEYKFFERCTVSLADSMTSLLEEKFFYESKEFVNVVIYY